MKVDVLDLNGKKVKVINLPKQFNEEFRPNIIKRAFLALVSYKRQKYGAKPEAGKRASAKLSRRRKSYKGAYGHGISRVPRKTLWKRGAYFGWVGAVAPGTVGGRRAHPPKASKILEEKINKKERRKAIRSAIAASFNKELNEKRGHKLNSLVIENKFEDLSKTKEVIKILENLGLKEELKRSSIKKVRAGKGKMRNRKYKKKKGALLVVSKKCPLLNSARNIPGIDICLVNTLNVELLAPGASAGRLTIYTEDSIERLEKEKLFY